MKRLLKILTLLFVGCTLAVAFCACGDHKEPQVYSVKYETTIGGSILGEAEQTVVEGDSCLAVTAVPNAGYEFVEWSDGIKTAERTDTEICIDFTVTATFKKLQYTVRYITNGNGTIEGSLKQTVAYGEDAETVTAIAYEGYRFEKWTDGETDAVRKDSDVKQDIVVTAIFERVPRHTIKYTADYGGTWQYILYDGDVAYGKDAPTITAKPRDFLPGCVFIEWSDGVKTAERTDRNITSDIDVTAYFGYSVTYSADEKYCGGHIDGEGFQVVRSGELFSTVTAIPDEGYMFAGWSDLCMNATRQDACGERSIDLIAYFEPIKKTFRYDYGLASGIPTLSTVTIERDDIDKTEFIIPQMHGYTFEGWFAENDYKTKVVNGDGIYMLGNRVFMLDTDTLYAKWEQDDINSGNKHKVLFVFVDSVNAVLYSSIKKQNIDVYYQMSAIEREFCSAWLERFSFYLNEWFQGITEFEVDAFYTTEPVYSESFSGGVTSYMTEYGLLGKNISQIGGLINKYHNVMTMFGMNDYERLLHGASGTAEQKYGCVYMEEALSVYIINDRPLQDVLVQFINNELNDNETVVYTMLHEFTHTCEMNYYDIKIEYHEALKAVFEPSLSRTPEMETTRKFLLGILELDEEAVGMPMGYWLHEDAVSVNYVPEPLNGKNVGKVVVGGETEELPSWITYVARLIDYGSDLCVEAIPQEGYKFLCWSDGVTTAVRYDKNIISYLTVKAIFVREN